jgi:hypothetical protein
VSRPSSQTPRHELKKALHTRRAFVGFQTQGWRGSTAFEAISDPSPCPRVEPDHLSGPQAPIPLHFYCE